jgi:hypothetical protein
VQYYLSDEERKYFSKLPMPISIAQIINNKIHYLHVSSGFLKLFDLEANTALKYLNSDLNENPLVYDKDKDELRDFLYQIIKKPKISKEFIFRARKSLDNNYFYLNCVDCQHLFRQFF